MTYALGLSPMCNQIIYISYHEMLYSFRCFFAFIFQYGYQLSWAQILSSCAMIPYQTLEFFLRLLTFTLLSLIFWVTEHNSDMLYFYNALLNLGARGGFVVSYNACLDYILLYFLIAKDSEMYQLAGDVFFFI